MSLLVASFFAGVLTAGAPCVLPLLPVIIGGSVATGGTKADWKHPVVITVALAASVVVFTLLLKATTALLGVPQEVWRIVSGLIVIGLGLVWLFPSLWERTMARTGLGRRSQELLQRSGTKVGYRRDVLIGASLGPVFASCSPTYALIVAVTLPASFLTGFTYLLAYAAGLALALLLIAFAGQSVARRLGWLTRPDGAFLRVVGALFVVTGLVVLFGFDKDLQAWVLEQGWYEPIEKLDRSLQGN